MTGLQSTTYTTAVTVSAPYTLVITKVIVSIPVSVYTTDQPPTAVEVWFNRLECQEYTTPLSTPSDMVAT